MDPEERLRLAKLVYEAIAEKVQEILLMIQHPDESSDEYLRPLRQRNWLPILAPERVAIHTILQAVPEGLTASELGELLVYLGLDRRMLNKVLKMTHRELRSNGSGGKWTWISKRS